MDRIIVASLPREWASDLRGVERMLADLDAQAKCGPALRR